VFDLYVNIGAKVEIVAERGKFFAHDGVRDDRIDLNRGDVVTPGRESARHIKSAARSDDQGLSSGANGVGQCGAVFEQLAALIVAESIEIEVRDAGLRIRVNAD